MAIHIGKTIQRLVKNKGISVTKFADKINYSRRNVYEIFEKESIDTGLLIKINKILGENLFLEYVSKEEISQLTKENYDDKDMMTVLLEIQKSVGKIEKSIKAKSVSNIKKA